ncbi:MAG: 2-oxoacid:acceptor oxidoreductase family protein [Chloroflexota bacterium]|nr:2-oxoacid:acceptor oxidoreductase family protein [Chloroflexota bacterium]
MEQKERRRHEVLFAGLGGGGVLVSAEILARATIGEYGNVVWFPYYGAQQRGGQSQCFVTFDTKEIASPYVARPEAVIALEQSVVKTVEDLVRPDGLLVTEIFGLTEKVGRKDIRVLEVPGIQVAMEIGEKRAANFVLLGAYLGALDCLPPEALEAMIEERFGKEPEQTFAVTERSKKAQFNIDAFRKGLEIAKKN